MSLPRQGTPVLSRNGAVRGRTLGWDRPCPSHGCRDTYGPRRLIAVGWETGDTTVICEIGWEHRPGHIRITGSAEGCDCDQTDDGRYVWMVHHTMKKSALTGEQVFDIYGDDVEQIEVRSEAVT